MIARIVVKALPALVFMILAAAPLAALAQRRP